MPKRSLRLTQFRVIVFRNWSTIDIRRNYKNCHRYLQFVKWRVWRDLKHSHEISSNDTSRPCMEPRVASDGNYCDEIICRCSTFVNKILPSKPVSLLNSHIQCVPDKSEVPDNAGSRFLWNVSIHLSDYKWWHPTKQQCLSSTKTTTANTASISTAI